LDRIGRVCYGQRRCIPPTQATTLEPLKIKGEPAPPEDEAELELVGTLSELYSAANVCPRMQAAGV
jgi:hypothetical protein